MDKEEKQKKIEIIFDTLYAEVTARSTGALERILDDPIVQLSTKKNILKKVKSFAEQVGDLEYLEQIKIMESEIFSKAKPDVPMVSEVAHVGSVTVESKRLKIRHDSADTPELRECVADLLSKILAPVNEGTEGDLIGSVVTQDTLPQDVYHGDNASGVVGLSNIWDPFATGSVW